MNQKGQVLGRQTPCYVRDSSGSRLTGRDRVQCRSPVRDTVPAALSPGDGLQLDRSNGLTNSDFRWGVARESHHDHFTARRVERHHLNRPEQLTGDPVRLLPPGLVVDLLLNPTRHRERRLRDVNEQLHDSISVSPQGLSLAGGCF